MAETAVGAIGCIEFFDYLEGGLNHWNENHLRDAVSGFNAKRGFPSIPAGNIYLALVVRLDQAYQVAQHNDVIVHHAGAMQEYAGQRGFKDVDGDPVGDQYRISRQQGERILDTGTQIHPR